MPVVTIIATLPRFFRGIGLRENSLVLIMIALGAANDKATLVSLLTFMMLIIVGIIGGVTYNIRPYIEAGTRKNGKLKENSGN